ncbi:LysE family transporter [Streptomyces sp. N2-109]|uniref:LysE family transporter n=1 Tax=Streptomyces gossypii TaxID=2883101 RepID=A0ABT2JM10_9ACTN|nr:LysE family transporter [Streptomyces gossypii]MCT2588917.1 LysE family transporter [Streptomyces gossypii]
MTESILAGLWAGYALAIPVGALAVLLVNLAARTSFRVGASGALGVATADGSYAALALLGGAAVAHAVRPVAGPLRWVAALVLVAMAVRIAVTALRSRGAPEAPGARHRGLGAPWRAYLGFLGLTLLNPWTIIYFSALVLGRQAGVGGDAGVLGGIAYVAAVTTASASWQLLLAAGGTVLGRALTGPRGRMVTAVVSSVVITALAVGLLLLPA